MLSIKIKHYITIFLAITISTVTTSCLFQNRNTINEQEKYNLVDIMSIDSSIVLDLRYASENNFLGKAVYSKQKCYLLKSTATKLADANKNCQSYGLRIKIFDGYRPHSVQIEMWKLVPNPMYVADPAKGSHHNRGCAVDVTLVDSLGNEIPMPTDFDDFTEKAHHDYMNLPDNVIRNRELLREIMMKTGFVPLNSEWWHYSTPDCGEYDILDIPLN